MVRVGTDSHGVLDQARVLLEERHGLGHATLQIEPDDHRGATSSPGRGSVLLCITPWVRLFVCSWRRCTTWSTRSAGSIRPAATGRAVGGVVAARLRGGWTDVTWPSPQLEQVASYPEKVLADACASCKEAAHRAAGSGDDRCCPQLGEAWPTARIRRHVDVAGRALGQLEPSQRVIDRADWLPTWRGDPPQTSSGARWRLRCVASKPTTAWPAWSGSDESPGCAPGSTTVTACGASPVASTPPPACGCTAACKPRWPNCSPTRCRVPPIRSRTGPRPRPRRLARWSGAGCGPPRGGRRGRHHRARGSAWTGASPSRCPGPSRRLAGGEADVRTVIVRNGQSSTPASSTWAAPAGPNAEPGGLYATCAIPAARHYD